MKKLCLKISIALVFFSSFPILSFSQNKNFRKWSINDGLPNSVIYCIKQDARGYLWLGTGNGVCYFDGKIFKSFSKKEGLSGNEVRSIFEDSYGRLWFGTNEGITFYDGLKFKTIGKKEGLAGTSVLCFLEDYKKNIWAGTDDGGLNIISQPQKDSFNIKVLNTNNGLSNNSVFDLFEDKEHSVWAATYGGGINILQQQNDSCQIKIVKGNENIPSDYLLSISGDNKGNLWFGTYDVGAFKVRVSDKAKGKFSSTLLNIANGLNSNTVYDILNTKDGNSWFGTTDNGITRMFPENGRFKNKISSYKTEQGISGNRIYCLFEDRENNIWIGTNGDGLCMLSGNYFSHYNKSDGLPENKIRAITQDKKAEGFWLASSGGGLAKINFVNQQPLVKVYSEKDGFPNNFTSSIAMGNDFNKNIWIGTDANGIVKYDGKRFYSITYEKDGLISDRVDCILVDSKGIVWCGTSDGISRFDGVKFVNTSAEMLKVSSAEIKAIIEDKAGNIWFAGSGGLARYSNGKNIRTFDNAEGLANVNVNAITEDNFGNIWIGTNEGGIYKFNKNKPDSIAIEFVADDKTLASNSIHSLIFYDANTLIAGTNKGFDKLILDENGKIISNKSYDASDGFTGIECNDNAICKDDEGNIWFGTMNGLTKYSPQFERKKILPPSIQLTGIQLFFKDVDWTTKSDSVLKWSKLPTNLSLPSDENHLTFHFSGISFSNPEKIRYKYILEGGDKDWSPLSSLTTITFSGLSKGHYKFKVIAIDANGVSSTPAIFSFEIQPPWYETKLFYSLTLLVIGFSVYFLIKFREKKLIEEKRELEKIVTERTYEIVLQKEHIAEKNREITDSINYAKGIQSAMLPAISDIKNSWKDLFIFFQPKDIVSGDFYWFQAINENEFLIACADCTGHGVPGGFMSMVCSDKLHESAKEFLEPAQILHKTNNAVKISLRQQIQVEGKNKDGMEICLLKINTKTKQVSYAGANRLLWIVNSQTRELTEIKPTKASIASFTEFNFEYQQHDFVLKEGDLLYTTSDGYPDQFGGAFGKKYMSKKLKTLIQESCHLPMDEQYQLFSSDINSWMEGREQVDDLLMIGIKL